MTDQSLRKAANMADARCHADEMGWFTTDYFERIMPHAPADSTLPITEKKETT